MADAVVTNTYAELNGAKLATTASAPTLLASLTASASATLDFTSRNATGQSGALFQSDYSIYKIFFDTVIPDTDRAHFAFRVSHNGGSTWDSSSGDYYYVITWLNSALASGSYNDVSLSSTYAAMGDNVDSNTATSWFGVDGELTLFKPTSTRMHKWHSVIEYSGGPGPTFNIETSFGRATSTSAVDSIRFFFSTGNITSGTIRVFGLGA